MVKKKLDIKDFPIDIQNMLSTDAKTRQEGIAELEKTDTGSGIVDIYYRMIQAEIEANRREEQRV